MQLMSQKMQTQLKIRRLEDTKGDAAEVSKVGFMAGKIKTVSAVKSDE